jgi:hypothetical protein
MQIPWDLYGNMALANIRLIFGQATLKSEKRRQSAWEYFDRDEEKKITYGYVQNILLS